MAASVAGVLEPSLQAKINESKLLVVGAGGIGCEVLKNLVMTGFSDIEIVSDAQLAGGTLQSIILSFPSHHHAP